MWKLGSLGTPHIESFPRTKRANRFTPQSVELCHNNKTIQNAASAENYRSQEAAERRVTNLLATRNQVKRRIALALQISGSCRRRQTSKRKRHETLVSDYSNADPGQLQYDLGSQQRGGERRGCQQVSWRFGGAR